MKRTDRSIDSYVAIYAAVAVYAVVAVGMVVLTVRYDGVIATVAAVCAVLSCVLFVRYCRKFARGPVGHSGAKDPDVVGGAGS